MFEKEKETILVMESKSLEVGFVILNRVMIHPKLSLDSKALYSYLFTHSKINTHENAPFCGYFMQFAPLFPAASQILEDLNMSEKRFQFLMNELLEVGCVKKMYLTRQIAFVLSLDWEKFKLPMEEVYRNE